MTNEYIFFDSALRDRFLAFLAARGLAGDIGADVMEGDVVALPDDLPDDLDAAVEAEYEALMEEQRALTDAADDDDARDLVGVTVRRADGSTLEVRLPSHHARRLFAHFSVEEIHDLVAAIVDSALAPAEGPLCRRSFTAP